jgi:hypothetical protein
LGAVGGWLGRAAAARERGKTLLLLFLLFLLLPLLLSLPRRRAPRNPWPTNRLPEQEATTTHPTQSSSTSHALRSDSSIVLVHDATAAACLSFGSMRETSLPPWGIWRPSAVTAMAAAGAVAARLQAGGRGTGVMLVGGRVVVQLGARGAQRNGTRRAGAQRCANRRFQMAVQQRRRFACAASSAADVAHGNFYGANCGRYRQSSHSPGQGASHTRSLLGGGSQLRPGGHVHAAHSPNGDNSAHTHALTGGAGNGLGGGAEGSHFAAGVVR